MENKNAKHQHQTHNKATGKGGSGSHSKATGNGSPESRNKVNGDGMPYSERLALLEGQLQYFATKGELEKMNKDLAEAIILSRANYGKSVYNRQKKYANSASYTIKEPLINVGKAASARQKCSRMRILLGCK